MRRSAQATTFEPVAPQSMSDSIYLQLRERLMRGLLKPHQRLRIRELAEALGTSETPVREAVFQLVRDRALDLKPRHYIRVRRLSVAEYLEIRDIRLKLEPLAAERALLRMNDATLATLSAAHARLVRAEADRDYDTAIRANFDFHFGLYRQSDMPVLIEMLESLWIQVGPMLNFLYPYGHPTYAGKHQHAMVLEALRRRDVDALCEAIREDLIEGGQKFLEHLQRIESEGAAGSDDKEED